jgi:DNA-binding XRE family transcriptional regulator
MKYKELCDMLLRTGNTPDVVSVRKLESIAKEWDVLPVVFYRPGGRPVTLSIDGIFQDHYDNYIGDAFKDARLSQGMSQGKLAAAVRVTPSTYSGYEQGTRGMRLPLFHRISTFLELRPEYLVDRADI